MKNGKADVEHGTNSGSQLLGRRRSAGVLFFVGLLLGAVFLYLAVRRTDIHSIVAHVRRADPFLLVAALIVGIVSNVVRAWRWKALFWDCDRVPLRTFFTTMMIGYLANNVLPARAGEVARILIFGRDTGVSRTETTATVILERVLDTLFLLTLVAGVSFFIPLPSSLRRVAQIGGIAFLAIFVALLTLAVVEGERVEKLRGGALLARFQKGLSSLRDFKQGLNVTIRTFLVWLGEAVAVYLVMKAVGIQLPFVAGLFVLVVLSLSFILPTAPGAIGTYEYFVILALTPFSVHRDLTLSFAFVLHAVVFFNSSMLGLISLSAESITFRQLRSIRSAN